MTTSSELSDYSFDDDHSDDGGSKKPPSKIVMKSSINKSKRSILSSSEYSFDDEEPVKKKNSSSIKKKIKTSKKKAVPYDVVHIPLPDKTIIDKLLSWRQQEEIELLVKYKNTSYSQCEWLSRSIIESMSKSAKSRIKKFMERSLYDIQWSEDEPFNPNFTKIDRIIDEGEVDGDLYFLVKWASLPYDECTWESEESVEKLDESNIDEYNERKVIPKLKNSKSIVRPNSVSWKKMVVSPPYKMGNLLRPYQLEGLNWLLYCWYNNQNSILADEMGLGKTIQSTSFINYLYTDLNILGPFLIVTPLSTLGNWEREIKSWTNLNVIVYHGKDTARNLIVDTEFYYKDENGDLLTNMFKFDVVLTTYEMAMSGIAQLRPIKWSCCILDEAHKLKNKSSKVSEILKQYSFDHKVLLTGTPLQNSLEELWSLLNFLDPASFGDENDFQKNYGNLNSAADVEKLQLLLKPLMLRRLKEDVEKSIPIKEETIVEVELTTIQKKWYRSILERNFSWLKQGSKKNNMPNLINTMIELRKCCIHPFLLKSAEDAIYDEYRASTPEQQFQVLIQASGKMVLIDKLLKKLKDGGHKVLLFSQMTKCLDIIQDYLKGRGYIYERIDGAIRGDMRQAAIDRFCAPNSESFVFLLCTRAGGVGINLTVADTVIIFDSDWNPQNDLQAQARCHRIGQKKSVKIYRLVTRNTYERDMLDRASMKLGLDKAVLQRMDTQSDSAQGEMNSSGAPSSLSKAEIESLLKKGAYGAFMDDEASNKFCEEDIDQILERRTQTIIHDNSTEKGSIFSKASFATSTTDNIDINDPDFWNKVAQKAQFEIVEEIDEHTQLILNEPRTRKQVQRFGVPGSRDSDDPMSEDETGVNPTGDSKKVPKGPNDPKIWSNSEKARLERMIMLFGFEIEKIAYEFPKRTIEDLYSIIRLLIEVCLRGPMPLEPEVISDINYIYATEVERVKSHYSVSEWNLPENTPYPDATEKEIAEYRSYYIDSNTEYKEHIERKSKNLLGRIQMLYTIKEKIKPTHETMIPIIPGNTPTPWWGEPEDRDLLIGVLKHGYGQYDKIREDPEYCYYPRYFDEQGNYKAAPEPVYDENNQSEESQRDIQGNPSNDYPMDLQSSRGQADKESSQGDITPPATDFMTDNFDSMADITMPIDTDGQQWFIWPSPAELGIRIRKIIAAFMRQQATLAKDAIRRQQAVEKHRLKLEKDHERQKLKENDLTRKDKIEFMRVLMSFGVEYDPEDPNTRTWTRFRDLTHLKKSDEAFDDYYLRIFELAHEVISKGDIERNESIKESKNPQVSKTTDYSNVEVRSNDYQADTFNESLPFPGETKFEGTGTPPETDEKTVSDVRTKFNPNLFKVERDGESITYEKAKRLLKRIEMMRTLREKVLPHPDFEERITSSKKISKIVLPVWWIPKYDKYFLHAISRWGFQRSGYFDLIIEDPSLPFLKLNREFKELTKTKEGTEEPGEDERFWPKESVVQRKFEQLIDSVMNSSHHQSDKSKSGKMSLRSTRNSEDFEQQTQTQTQTQTIKPIKIRLKYDNSETGPTKKKKKSSLAIPSLDPDDPTTTLEQLLSSNKNLALLYLQEYTHFYKKQIDSSKQKEDIKIQPAGVEDQSESELSFREPAFQTFEGDGYPLQRWTGNDNLSGNE